MVREQMLQARVALKVYFLWCFILTGSAYGQTVERAPALMATDQPVAIWIGRKLFHASNGYRSIEMYIKKDGSVDSVFVVNRIFDGDTGFEEIRDSLDKQVLMNLRFKPLKRAVWVRVKNYNIVKGSLFPTDCGEATVRLINILEGLYYDERVTYFSLEDQRKGYFIRDNWVIFEPSILVAKE